MSDYFNRLDVDPYNGDLPDTGFLARAFKNNLKSWEGNEQELYKKNIQVLDINRWRFFKEDITYKTNSEGFRCDKDFDEIDWKNTIAVVGCSFIYGQGMPSHLTVSSILTDDYDIPCVNMGCPGASNFMIHTNAIHVMKKYKPKKVIILWSHLNRNSWVYDYRTDWKMWLASHQNTLNISNSEKKDLKSKGFPSSFLENAYSPHTIHEYQVYKDIHSLLGNIQYSIADNNKSTDLRLLTNPKDSTIYDDWYRYYEESRRGGLNVKDENLYKVLNEIGARDIIWDGKMMHIGHWGETVLRDLADRIYRENFK